MDYEAVIGLEIHVELLTESKMFCSCSARSFGMEPNTFTCPVCLGFPGSLPVINKKAVEYTMRIALALNCEIPEFTQFHRKNYFYPDMPKNYQISQYDYPIGVNGYLEIDMGDYKKKVGIERVHLEEDTGKLIHIGGSGRISGADYSLVDFNRAGIPLVEIVTKPDISTPEEAKEFMRTLRNILLHLEVSDCNMEEGSLRCDANISLRKRGEKELGTKTEIKNLNSFRALQRGLQYEIERQARLIESGEEIVQETRHFDAQKNITTVLRTKEEAHDYRYFPDPDLVPLSIDRAWVEEVESSLPELPTKRKERFMEVYGLSSAEAKLLTSSKALGDFFEECYKLFPQAKKIANWILSDLTGLLNEAGLEIDECAVTPKHLAELLKLVEKKVVSTKLAKMILSEMFETGKLPQVIVEEKGLTQIADRESLLKFVEQAILENPQAVEDFKKGKKQAIGFLVGQVMKLTRGKANPQMVTQILTEKLSS
jgi:aspartyl-tRNA(Asn)/glutamyl-tRNA(Gln) amidotransferase subunit B